jgi:corrinoid protein of di/trimethylamine methyltransferase
MTRALLEEMARSIVEGEAEEAESLARRAIAEGMDPLQAIDQGFVRGLDEVGLEFGCGNLFLPDLVMAAEAMKAAIAVLEPELARQGTARDVLGKVVIGTVDGDIHDIGKTLVATMLAANGFQVFDLGVSVRTEKFAAQAREVGADIVGLSALLTTTMDRQREVIEALDDLGLRPRVKVMVGGAPVTGEWAARIGADGYSEDAIGAVALARELMQPKEEQP